MQPFLDVSPADLRRTLSVNLEGVFTCGQAAARAMVRSGRPGTIVNVASMAGKQGRVPYLADYVASKFGVVGLTQAMAFELAPHHITVNSVCPGYVATPMQDRELGWESALRGVEPGRVLRLWIEDTPLGRLETPEDVARAVAFLAGPDARFITGEALAVNGGAFMDLGCGGRTRSGRAYPVMRSAPSVCRAHLRRGRQAPRSSRGAAERPRAAAA
jgi:meso-butanediol dehydrogenase/(S,S)-butanediol dehydrogenase/diacetyl reductase